MSRAGGNSDHKTLWPSTSAFAPLPERSSGYAKIVRLILATAISASLAIAARTFIGQGWLNAIVVIIGTMVVLYCTYHLPKEEAVDAMTGLHRK